MCAPERTTPGATTRVCGDLPLDGVDVTIKSQGEVVWMGTTSNEGDVEARFPNTGEFLITVSGEPWIDEVLTSEPVAPHPEGQPLTEYLFTKNMYVLEWLQEAPVPQPEE